MRHRSRFSDRSFPETWRRILQVRLPAWGTLDAGERSRLEDLIHEFVTDKLWEGAAGLEPTEEIEVTISAHACLLILELDLAHFRDVTSIIVYPTTTTRRGERAVGGGVFTQTPSHLLGEARLHGPVMVAWDAVVATSRLAPGRNLVQHEFAHKLDMLDGFADGIPPIHDRLLRDEFADVTMRAYEDLTTGIGPLFLDLYATTNRVEFFAVATEAFFNRPVRLRQDRQDLYEVLRSYYRQEPAARASRASLDDGLPKK